MCSEGIVNYNFSIFSWTFSAILDVCVIFTREMWIEIVKPLTSVNGTVVSNGFLAKSNPSCIKSKYLKKIHAGPLLTEICSERQFLYEGEAHCKC